MEEARLSLILQGSETDKEPYQLSVLKSLMKRGSLSQEASGESKQEVQGPKMALEG